MYIVIGTKVLDEQSAEAGKVVRAERNERGVEFEIALVDGTTVHRIESELSELSESEYDALEWAAQK